MSDVTRRSARGWRVGEVAEATGLTVRTLHHYEQIGLLPRAARTEGRQRLFDEDDIRRLYRIRSLRELGLSLAEIGGLLEHETTAIGDLLREHLARVDAELARLSRLRERLERACAHADAVGDAEAILATIEAMTRVEDHVAARSAGGRTPDDLEAQWRELGEALRSCMDAGDEPSAPRVQATAKRARAGLIAFADGDPAVLDALGRLRRATTSIDLAGWDAALLRYLDRALAALDELDDQ